MNKNENELGSAITAHSTVGEWVAEFPVTFQVFRDFDIDVCLGGFIPLRDACQRKQIDSWVVLEKLMDAINENAKPTPTSQSNHQTQ